MQGVEEKGKISAKSPEDIDEDVQEAIGVSLL